MSRRKSREVILQTLFQREFNPSLDFHQSLQLFQENFSQDNDSLDYAKTILEGILPRISEVDELISKYSRRWHIDRLMLVDKNVIRVAIYEIKFMGIDPKVSIDEAIQLAKKYGTNDSGSFVNGLLDSFCKDEGFLK